jgi:3-hydroxyisobutyrate dehydrogenase-like beta-hydroxyacid dehydrogenase
MLVSGDGADRYAEILASLGIRVTIQPGSIGEASSRKLLRSVLYKGLAAAVVEALAAAEAAGCAEWLRGNISAELAAADEETINRLIDGTHRHAKRRAEEMTAAAEQVNELGVRTRIAAAARDQLIDLRARDTA